MRLRVGVIGWRDGDTFYGVTDHGLGLYRGAGLEVSGFSVVVKPIRHRSWGIQAPELKTGDPGRISTEAAWRLAPPGVYDCVSYKPDDFGRPLVDLVLPDGVMFSWAMVNGGFAVRKEA